MSQVETELFIFYSTPGVFPVWFYEEIVVRRRGTLYLHNSVGVTSSTVKMTTFWSQIKLHSYNDLNNGENKEKDFCIINA